MYYNYYQRCIREDCIWNTRQLGQHKSCPIHNGSTSTMRLVIDVGPWNDIDIEMEVKPYYHMERFFENFVDPAMAQEENDKYGQYGK